MLIESQSQFDDWLDENYRLIDVRVLDIAPHPKGVASPDIIDITLSLQIAGGYCAGDLVTIREIQLRAFGVQKYELNGNFWYPSQCAEGVDSLDVDGLVSFAIEVPGRLEIAASHIQVVSTADTQLVQQERLSDHDYSVKGEGISVPTPQEWLEYFHHASHDVVWRYYSGDARETGQVPVNAYSGWFLQYPDRLKTQTGGLLFNFCRTESSGFSLSLTFNDKACQQLWVLAGLYLASLANTTIKCGNAILTPAAFESHLRSTLPRGRY